MADSRITELALGTPKSSDLLVAVDTTDSTMAPTGTDKRYLRSEMDEYIINQISLSGDIAGPISSTVIEPNAVTNSKLDVMAAHTFKGNNTGSTSDPLDLTVAELTAELGVSANTPSRLVLRDGSGNFAAGTITASLSGNASTATSTPTLTGPLLGDITGTQSATVITAGIITNSMINSSAGIVDTKLATISTAGKVSNSATTATSSNTNSAIVSRDSSGNFSAGTITASLNGHSTSSTDFTGSLLGDISGTQSATVITSGVITNSMINASAAIVDTKLATISTSGKVSNSATTATSANTNSAIVARDSSGNFSAGSITATLVGNATTATTATNFSGSLSGNITGTQSATVIGSGVITNSMINASAAIDDTKLGTISTSGKVSNSATTATSSNTNSAIVARDSSGNFVAGRITLGTGLLLPTSGGTPDTLDYCESGTFTYTMSGPFTSGTLTANFVRIGKMVTIFFPSFSGTSTSATFFSSGASAIPTRLRPASGLNYDEPSFCNDNSVAQTTPSRFIVFSTGEIRVYKAAQSVNFTGSGTALVGNKYVTYFTS